VAFTEAFLCVWWFHVRTAQCAPLRVAEQPLDELRWRLYRKVTIFSPHRHTECLPRGNNRNIKAVLDKKPDNARVSGFLSQLLEDVAVCSAEQSSRCRRRGFILASVRDSGKQMLFCRRAPRRRLHRVRGVALVKLSCILDFTGAEHTPCLVSWTVLDVPLFSRAAILLNSMASSS
jgi:hypothetical protein